MSFDFGAYLDRIGNPELGGATAETLAALQTAQMRTIPFENIEVLNGGLPRLDIEGLQDKLIAQQRGGYCFELNGLFGHALAASGFDAQPILARVRQGAAEGKARTHQAFVVRIDGEDWLADTGFGGPAPAAPLRVAIGEEQMAGGYRFRMRRDAVTGETVVERWQDEDWFALYGFERTFVNAFDFETGNFITARWDKSPFPQHLMMTRLKGEGRVNVFNTGVKYVVPGGVEAFEMADIARFQTLLAEDFGIRLAPELLRATWQKIAANAAGRQKAG